MQIEKWGQCMLGTKPHHVVDDDGELDNLNDEPMCDPTQGSKQQANEDPSNQR